jgi:hypothetical protein
MPEGFGDPVEDEAFYEQVSDVEHFHVSDCFRCRRERVFIEINSHANDAGFEVFRWVILLRVDVEPEK